MPEPRRWEDLADARLAGAVTLVNPAQSGSVTTALEAILQRLGWEKGWRIIRRMSANARSVASSAPKVPLDVSAGDSAAGPCIDFYGRYQAQAIADAGDPGRIGYIDPKGETVIDPDPIALLANAPNRDTAIAFIEFVLSDEGQALWQFPAEERPEGALGPREFELRRMPVRRDFIARERGASSTTSTRSSSRARSRIRTGTRDPSSRRSSARSAPTAATNSPRPGARSARIRPIRGRRRSSSPTMSKTPG